MLFIDIIRHSDCLLGVEYDTLFSCGVRPLTNSFIRGSHDLVGGTISKVAQVRIFNNDRGKRVRLELHSDEPFSTTPNNWCAYRGNGKKSVRLHEQ